MKIKDITNRADILIPKSSIMNWNRNILMRLIFFFTMISPSIMATSGSSASQSKANRFSNDSIKETLLYQTRPLRYLTEAISSVDGAEMENIAGSNRFNMLAGRLTGLAVVQETGMPGIESGSVYLRGVNSFHRNGITYIVDGFQTSDIRMLDPYDIKSITVLKDAAATVLYGLKSTSGVIVVETRKGEKGKLKVGYNTGTALQTPLKLPKFVNSYDYAVLYNEAMLNDNPNAMVFFPEEDIQGYKDNKSPYEYPNVNWVDLMLKNNTVLTRHNVNFSGGSETVRYYLAGSYFHNTGVFNTDQRVNTYSTNTEVDVFNLHGNVDVNVNKNLSLSADIKSKKDTRNMPGGFASNYDESMLSVIYGTPAYAFQPLNYLGKLMGTQNYTNNPYGHLNYRGFTSLETNYISSTIQFSYKLDRLLQGLYVFGNIGFNSYAQIYTSRTKTYAVHRTNAAMSGWFISGLDSEISNSGGYNAMNRDYNQLIGLNYTKESALDYFNALLLVDRQQTKEYRYTSLTDNYQGLKGKFSYRHLNRYLLDLSFSYSGSNRFPTTSRYGFFPVAAAGWILSEEDFLKSDHLNFLKLRGSFGQTGNTINPYYEYLPAFGTASGAFFGTTPTQSTGISEARILNTTITWERTLKSNLGIDFGLFGNKLSGTLDLFDEKNRNILVANAVSVMYGDDFYNPVGKMNNRGFEVDLRWNDKAGDFTYFVGFNYSFARNTIVFQDEQDQAYPWMYRTGHPYGTRFGYVFDRYFVEEDDFNALPDHSFLGTVQPGDLKYKDLNGDNVIDESDVQNIGKPAIPEIVYGIQAGFSWKNIDFTILFQGLGNIDTYQSTAGLHWAMYNGRGNATEEHLNRWQPGSGQNASYPRLSFTTTNNYATSSYWVKDASFLRLKHLELGYNFASTVLQSAGISKARLFVNGSNLLTWSAITAFDPESTDTRYPITRAVSVGLNINF